MAGDSSPNIIPRFFIAKSLKHIFDKYALSHINREATLITISCGRFYASLWTRLLKKGVRSFNKVETIFRVCVQSNIIILWRELSWILYVTRQTQMSFLEVCTYIPRSFWTRLDKKENISCILRSESADPFQDCCRIAHNLKTNSGYMHFKRVTSMAT